MPVLSPGHPLLLTRDGLNVALGRRFDDPAAWLHAEAVKSLAPQLADRAVIGLCLAACDLITSIEHHHGWEEVWPCQWTRQVGRILDTIRELPFDGDLDEGTVAIWLEAVAARVGWHMGAVAAPGELEDLRRVT